MSGGKQHRFVCHPHGKIARPHGFLWITPKVPGFDTGFDYNSHEGFNTKPCLPFAEMNMLFLSPYWI